MNLRTVYIQNVSEYFSYNTGSDSNGNFYMVHSIFKNYFKKVLIFQVGIYSARLWKAVPSNLTEFMKNKVI